ncbi:MAG: molybdenum cofactor guanylyltransferase [Chloroflexota bacterium]
MPVADSLTLTILAGGRGSRLGGTDKAALQLAGRPLLDHVLAALGPLASEVVVVANDDRLAADSRFTLIRDPEPHAGVLPALLASLDAATSPLMLLVACDMPFLSRPLFGELVRLAAQFDAVVPRVDGFDQPMHAVYRVEPCRAAIRSALAQNRRRMIAFLDDVRTLHLAEPEVRRLDPELRSFFNVNTPDDLELAERLAAER